jgi:putative ABC transport system permease protein
MPFTVEGRPAPAPGQEPHAPFRVISPDYFRALRIPQRHGRTFSESDARISVPVIRWYASQRNPENLDKPQPAPVAIISESMARQYWPGEDPIGQRIRVLFSPWMTIVGVVGDVRHGSLDSPSYPHIYVPYTQEPWGFMTLVVRTSDDPRKFAGAVREQVRALDVSLPVGITAMDDLFSDSVGLQRFYLSMLVAFGTVALLLAAVGILGVVSYAVTQRIREIGVRMALGAQRADIVRLIITQNMAPTLFGVGIGACGAFALTRLIKGLLYEVNPADPFTFVAMCALLAAVALVACYVPARRAAKVDPMVALRYE